MLACVIEAPRDARTARVQSVEIPIPPSVNNHVAARGRVFLPKVVHEWFLLTVPIMQRHLDPVEAPCRISLQLVGGKGLNESRDVDNFLKHVLDALQAPKMSKANPNQLVKPGASILPNDNLAWVHGVRVDYLPCPSKGNKRPEATCLLVIEEDL